MDLNKKKISIIIPVYKVEKELDRCLYSILNQTYKNIEIILVDDGSPDRCPMICDSYADMDERIQVIHKKNGGLSDARNAGLKQATGAYVLFVDSDDYIELDACEKLLGAMHDGVDIVAGAYKEVRGNRISYQKHTNLIDGKVYSSKEFIIASIKNNEWYAPAWLNLYDRLFLLNNNLFYKVGYYFEDMEMLPRLFLAADKVSYVNYAFYNYIIRDNSIMTSSPSKEKTGMILAIYDEWMEILQKVDDKFLQKYLFGILIRFYLCSCRVYPIKGWKVKGLNFKFAWKYALNFKEKFKVLFFQIVFCFYKE